MYSRSYVYVFTVPSANVASWLSDRIKNHDKVKELGIPPEFVIMFAIGFDSGDKFCYEFDNIVKILEMRRDNVKRILTNNYEEDGDFITLLSAEDAKKTGQKEKIMITGDCFKMLCMQAQNERGKMVRVKNHGMKWYIDLRLR